MLQLSKNQIIGLGAGIVLVITVLTIFLTSKKQSFQEEEEACKWLNGNDVVYYKLDGTDLTHTMRKINYQQLESLISQINTDLEECKIIQFGGFQNPYYDKPRFRSNIRAIKTRYNRISTLCKDEADVLRTNKNAKAVPQNANDFLNLLDKYLNTVLYPYITKIKLDDNDASNDIYNEPIPDTFKQFYEKNTPKTYQANILSQAIANPEEPKPVEKKDEPKPVEKKDEKKEEPKPVEKKDEPKPAEKKDGEKKREGQQGESNIGVYFISALIVVVLVLIFKK